MGFETYEARKARGMINVVRVGDNFAMVEKRYDQLTGDEGQAHLTALSIDELNARKRALQDEIDGIDALIVDLQALP